jgi:hypothetical protein
VGAVVVLWSLLVFSAGTPFTFDFAAEGPMSDLPTCWSFPVGGVLGLALASLVTFAVEGGVLGFALVSAIAFDWAPGLGCAEASTAAGVGAGAGAEGEG